MKNTYFKSDFTNKPKEGVYWTFQYRKIKSTTIFFFHQIKNLQVSKYQKFKNSFLFSIRILYSVQVESSMTRQTE